MRRAHVELVVLGAFVLVLAYMALDLRGAATETRLFPFVIMVPALLLVVVQVGRSVRAWRAGEADDDAASNEYLDVSWNRDTVMRLLRLGLWLAGFIAAMYLVGFIVGLCLGVGAYVRFEARERWRLALAIAAGSFAYLYLVFEAALSLNLPTGYLPGLLP